MTGRKKSSLKRQAAHAVLMACGMVAGFSLPVSDALRLAVPVAVAAEGDIYDKDAPVDLAADKLVHDEETQIITASGNVELIQAGRILRADEVRYNLATDTVTASGNVVLNEVNGDVHFADEVEFTDKMRNGFVKGLKSLLADGSRFAAAEGERQDGTVIIMRQASYTPCEPCKENPDKPPVWQIKAAEVKHDDGENRISYRDASFEVAGVPVAWMPYFSHPDGTVKRKSGFLTPSFGFDSELGGIIENSYYWAIAPDKDATIGMMLTTKEAPVLLGEYRQRWAKAELETRGSLTYSGRKDSVAGQEVKHDDEVRGHMFAEGLWDINDKWRAGLDLELASDDQYLRQYDFSSKDVLENELYVERFSGRNYAVGRLLGFQDVRVGEERRDQPSVLPEVVASFYGEPNALLKGRWSLEASALGLSRDGNGQDVGRLVVDAGWERRMLTDFGLVSTIDASLRGDVYHTRDSDVTTSGTGVDDETTETRGFAQLHMETSYPLVRPMEKAQAVIEPVAALTLAPNIDVDGDIPNEDSQDVQVDASNLFSESRFPGKDRVEDKSRATYGIRTGLYGYEGSHADVFVGQSYGFDDDDNAFPEGSGLNSQESDVVGQVSASYKGNHGVNYRFQLRAGDLSSERHEVDAYTYWNRFRLRSRYLYANALEGTDIDRSREQIQGWSTVKLSEHWNLNGSMTYDLGEDPGMRKASLGAGYIGQCFTFSATAERELTRDSSGDSGTDIMFRIGLKNLGEFETSGLSIDSSGD